MDQSPVHKTKLRYIILVLTALVLFGNNYSFDNPQALQHQIMRDIGLTYTEYSLMYTVFSLPNVFLTFAGGFLIDRLGGRTGVLIFTFLVTLSQFIVAVGGWLRQYDLMLWGRAIFGISSENLIIAQNVIITTWFKGNELSTATGIILTLPEISSALNSFCSPLIYEYTRSIAYPLFTSVFVCLFSLVCAFLLVFFDQMADKSDDGQTQQQKEKASLSDLRGIPHIFWYLVTICTLCLGIYIPFMDDITDYYQVRFDFETVHAGRLVMIPYLVSALFSPFIGYFVDKIGHRRFFLMITSFIFVLAQTLFMALPNQQSWVTIIPLVMQGLAFACYSCIMIPCIQYIIDQRVMGTAFGILGMMESVALSVFPMIAGEIVDQGRNPKNGYKEMSLFYAILGLGALFLSISLYHFESSTKLDYVDPNNPQPEEVSRTHDYSMITNER